MGRVNILVTGGAGFIGSNFIRYILNKYENYYITNLDKLTYAGNLDNLKDIEDNPRYLFLRGDICDATIVQRAMEKTDFVVHFAAESHVDRSIREASNFIETNVYGTYILLEVAKKLKIQKFVHVSTDEVYGSIDNGSFKETDPLNPSSPYSSSKAGSDLLALSYKTTFGLPVIITRSANNFGPYQYPEKIISLFITNILTNKKVPVYGDGKNVRNWLYVIDNCVALDTVLHKGRLGEIYNIGSNNEINNLELTNKVLSLMGKDNSFINYVKDRLGHDKRYSLDSTKMKELGWEPKYKFEDALKDTIDWFADNEWWWKSINKNRIIKEEK